MRPAGRWRCCGPAGPGRARWCGCRTAGALTMSGGAPTPSRACTSACSWPTAPCSPSTTTSPPTAGSNNGKADRWMLLNGGLLLQVFEHGCFRIGEPGVERGEKAARPQSENAVTTLAEWEVDGVIGDENVCPGCQSGLHQRPVISISEPGKVGRRCVGVVHRPQDARKLSKQCVHALARHQKTATQLGSIDVFP